MSVIKFGEAVLGAVTPTKFIKITAGPAVFDCGDCYAVMWATNFKGTGKLIISNENGEKALWDEQCGVIKTHDRIHCVRVCKEELSASTYYVESERVMFKFSYLAIRGRKTKSEKRRFVGCGKADDINLLTVSDVHDKRRLMYKALLNFSAQPDIIALIGDISSTMETKSQFIRKVLKTAGKISGGAVPVIYTRGNHETRGEFASKAAQYFPTETGELYYRTAFGALSAVVIDSGEDKEDSHEEYSGLVDFSNYRQQELAWLNGLERKDFDSKYLIALSHVPHIDNHFGADWTAPLKSIGVQLIIGGHYHETGFDDGALPVYINCGKCNATGGYAASMLNFKDGEINILSINDLGETVFEKQLAVDEIKSVYH